MLLNLILLRLFSVTSMIFCLTLISGVECLTRVDFWLVLVQYYHIAIFIKWIASNPSQQVEEKLDWVFANSEWCEKFFDARCYNMSTTSSDHSLIYLQVSRSFYRILEKHFRFKNA